MIVTVAIGGSAMRMRVLVIVVAVFAVDVIMAVLVVVVVIVVVLVVVIVVVLVVVVVIVIHHRLSAGLHPHDERAHGHKDKQRHTAGQDPRLYLGRDEPEQAALIQHHSDAAQRSGDADGAELLDVIRLQVFMGVFVSHRGLLSPGQGEPCGNDE
jgi:hypothetical protein